MQVFSVEGMTCGHCVKAVTQAIKSQDPAAEVTVDLAAKSTFTLAAGSWFCTAWVTARTQWPQVIPSTLNTCMT